MTEPLPDKDNRRALLFYEAAEGGAGVLTRLANETDHLAEVARSALKLMHFNKPQAEWRVSELDTLEKRRNGQRICEAGCYQCLLSYFNQPDHDKINRLDPDALELLVALANANVRRQITIKPEESNDASNTNDEATLNEWLSELDKRAFRHPDALSVPINNGLGTADAQYKSSRTLIFFQPPATEIQQIASERGYDILVFNERNQWSDLFSQHQHVFK